MKKKWVDKVSKLDWLLGTKIKLSILSQVKGEGDITDSFNTDLRPDSEPSYYYKMPETGSIKQEDRHQIGFYQLAALNKLDKNTYFPTGTLLIKVAF